MQPLSANSRQRPASNDFSKRMLPGLANQRFDAIHEHVGRRELVARDVIEANIAEAALFPITTVCNRELVPAPVRPEPVDGIEHVHQRQIVIERQTRVGGCAAFGEGNIRLFEVHVVKLSCIRAHEMTDWPLVLQMFDQSE